MQSVVICRCGIISKSLETHYFAHLGKGAGCTFAGTLGSLCYHATQVLVVAAYVKDALAYGGCCLEDILGELFLKVATY